MTGNQLRKPAHTGARCAPLVLASFLAVIGVGAASAADGRAATQGADLGALSGRELVRRLLHDDTRLAAFRELMRRKGHKDLDDLRRPEVVVCPQGPGKEPLYLVLSEFLTPFRRSDPFAPDDPEALFPEPPGVAAAPDPLAPREKLLIEVVTAEGEVETPFGGNNVLDGGIVRDIDGDGRIERVDYTPYGVDGVDHVDVLHVWSVERRSSPSLNVLYNWGSDDWGYQFADRDGDGRVEIELGPRQSEGVKPKVVLRWDERQKAFGSGAGTRGAHFFVLQPGDVWPQLKGLKRDGLTFPNDPDAVADRSHGRFGMRPPLEEPKVEPRSQPYVYRSLRDLDDEAVLRYMGRGRSVSDSEVQPTSMPPEFWTSSPRQAAMAFVERNRTNAHRETYRLAIDDRGGAIPPESGTLVLHDVSHPSYVASHSVWFLSARPGDSYLALASSTRTGNVFCDFVSMRPAFDLRLARVSDAEARHVLQTVWWLRRLRSKARENDDQHDGLSVGNMSSTGDGSGRLTLRGPDGRTIIDVSDSLWGGALGYRWNAEYETEVFLGFAAHLLEEALPERLGAAWRSQDTGGSRWSCRRPGGEAGLNARGRAILTRNAEQLLELYAPDERGRPPALASLAADAIGDLLLDSPAIPLERLLASLPPRDPRVRDEAAIEAELDALDAADKKAPAGDDTDSFEKRHERWRALFDELLSVRHGFDETTGRELLRGSLQLALRKLRTAGNLAALERWAAKDEPGWRFAMARLAEIDRAAYARALESWLGQAEGESRRQVFKALAQADPARARELAAALPSAEAADLTVAAFGLLAEAQAIPDEPRRVAALVALLRDTKSDWRERVRAVGVLVPCEQPLRFPERSVDEALLGLLKPPPDDEDGVYVVDDAARALARRGRTEALPALLQAWKLSEERAWGTGGGDVIGALADLVGHAGATERQLLAAALRARLNETRGLLSDVMLAIWAADLRELAPDVERVATSSPDDIEGDQVHTWRGGPATAVKDRFHLARKILAVWKEEDALTRARLLLAFGRFEPVLATPERTERIKAGLDLASRALSDDERARLRPFLEHIEASAEEDGEDWAEHTLELGRLAREAFGWPSVAMPDGPQGEPRETR